MKAAIVVLTLVLLPHGVIAQISSDLRFINQRGDTVRVPNTEGKRLAFTVNKLDPSQDAAASFAQRLFPPELVMQHQSCIKITPAQRNVIVAEITKLQTAAVQMQWNVADEAQKLTDILEREPVAEADALAQAERLIGYETAVKRAQLAMLIRIRNTLTAEQRTKLSELRYGTRVDMSRLTGQRPDPC